MYRSSCDPKESELHASLIALQEVKMLAKAMGFHGYVSPSLVLCRCKRVWAFKQTTWVMVVPVGVLWWI